MSIVFDARKRAERAKLGLVTAASDSQQNADIVSADSLGPNTDSNAAPDISADARPVRPEVVKPAPPRVARASASWAANIDVAGASDTPLRAPAVHTLLRTSQSEPAARADWGAPESDGFSQRRARIEPATLISKTEPVRPPAATDDELASGVELQFRVSPAGRVYAVKPVKGPARLLGAAARAVKSWRYEPARLNGAPIDSCASATIDFKLDGRQDS